MTRCHRSSFALCVAMLLSQIGCGDSQTTSGSGASYDVVIRGGIILDGSGSPSRVGDVAISGDKIVAMGGLDDVKGTLEIDASRLAVAPGFINMMSHTWDVLIEDGRAQSDIRQGVTLEVFGEGYSIGPLNDAMKSEILALQTRIQYPIEWTTLGEGMEYLVQKGISPNVAAFVGATTVRTHVLGHEDRAPSRQEIEQMQSLVRQAMQEGALGVGALLISAPGFYADTQELIALARIAAEYGGSYISHIRSEGDYLLEAVDELINIARDAGLPAEIYHLKAAGKSNWHKLDEAIRKVEAARSEGLQITADVYAYSAAFSPLSATMPRWVQEGGFDAWVRRLRDPSIRARVSKAMRQPGEGWENLYLATGPEKIVFAVFQTEALKPLIGNTLAEVAALRGTSPEDTLMDLVIEDNSNVFTTMFLMSDENLRKKIQLPWASFCSAGFAMSTESAMAKAGMHPRSYGNFSKVLAKYVRDEKALSLEDAIRRLTSFPAGNLKLDRRGLLEPGYFADVVVFDPAKIQDHATFENPHQYSTGMIHVFVNGEQVLKNGEHTGALPGRFLRGPGWKQ